MRAGALLLSLFGGFMAVGLGLALAVLETTDDLLGDEHDVVLTTPRAGLWFAMAVLGVVGGLLTRREPRRGAVLLALAAAGGVIVGGGWWLFVGPFFAVAAVLAFSGRGGADRPGLRTRSDPSAR